LKSKLVLRQDCRRHLTAKYHDQHGRVVCRAV
jgi:hypothetical protein